MQTFYDDSESHNRQDRNLDGSLEDTDRSADEEQRPMSPHVPSTLGGDTLTANGSITEPRHPSRTVSFSQHDDADDTASTLARSTYSGYTETPSTIGGEKEAIASGQYISPAGPSSRYRPQRTPGRKAFVGACEVVNAFVPIDINHDATSMDDSGFAKLGRAIKGKKREGSVDQGSERRMSESILSRSSTIRA